MSPVALRKKIDSRLSGLSVEQLERVADMLDMIFGTDDEDDSTEDFLSDDEFMRGFKEGLEDARSGRVYSAEEACARYGI